jgi:succinate dehydrogenase/fumarate reductase flavoprotein subunit
VTNTSQTSAHDSSATSPTDVSGQLDVIVIGGGGSGLAAAIGAASVGRRVLLLEKAPQLGGSTALSIGSISATASPQQIALGIKDAPAGHYEDMPKFAAHLKATDNDDLRHILTNEVPTTLRWLMGLGVEFFGPMPERPHQQPRMHNVVPNSRAYIAHCARQARHLGVDIRVGTRATGFIIEGGRVRGVRATLANGEKVEYRATGGVVLASGDYSADPDLKREFISPTAATIQPVNVNSTGDGHRMAREIGATVINSHLAHIGVRFIPPPRRSLAHLLPASRLLARLIRIGMQRLPMAMLRPFLMKFLVTVTEPAPNLFAAGAVLIGNNGGLVGDWNDDRIASLGAADGHQGYILFDAAIADAFESWPNYISTAPGIAYAYVADYRRNRADLFHVAPTLEAVAEQVGMPGQTIAASLETINAKRNGVRDGVPAPLAKGPFYLLGPVKLFITFTDGGLAVDTSHRVLAANGSPIPGLYAAGSAGQGGLLLEGHGHHLGWAFTSGRLAGRNAAYESISPPS